MVAGGGDGGFFHFSAEGTGPGLGSRLGAGGRAAGGPLGPAVGGGGGVTVPEAVAAGATGVLRISVMSAGGGDDGVLEAVTQGRGFGIGVCVAADRAGMGLSLIHI